MILYTDKVFRYIVGDQYNVIDCVRVTMCECISRYKKICIKNATTRITLYIYIYIYIYISGVFL